MAMFVCQYLFPLSYEGLCFHLCLKEPLNPIFASKARIKFGCSTDVILPLTVGIFLSVLALLGLGEFFNELAVAKARKVGKWHLFLKSLG